MNRKKRTEILIKGSLKAAKKMSEEISHKYDVKIIDEPNNGLVMIKVRETSKGSPFF